MATHIGSWNSYLLEFETGERRYVETSIEKYPQMMRTINAPKSRRPAVLTGREFKTELFTAVSAARAGEVRFLICIERTI